MPAQIIMLGIVFGVLSTTSFVFTVYLFKESILFNHYANIFSLFFISVASLVCAYGVYQSRIFSLYRCTGKPTAFMPVHVSRLTRGDIISVFVLILYKYVLQALGLMSKIETAPDGVHILLPNLQLSAPLAIDARDNIKFDLATRPSGHVNASKRQRLMLLPAVTTPMMAILLANRTFPVNALGSVNTKNTFEFLDAEACRNLGGTMDLNSTIVNARIGGKELLGRRVKQGIEFDITVEVIGPRLRSKEKKRLIFRQIFTILAFLPKTSNPPIPTDAREGDDLHWTWENQAVSSVYLDTNAPFRWAAVCADYNPIHVSTRMARIFGYANRIAHGNHALACCLETLNAVSESEGQTAPVKARQDTFMFAPSLKVAVQFRRPMILPTRLDVSLATYGTKLGLKGFRGDKILFTAQMSPLS